MRRSARALTPAQAARYIRARTQSGSPYVTGPVVELWIKAGSLPATVYTFTTRGSDYRIKPADIDAFVEARYVGRYHRGQGK